MDNLGPVVRVYRHDLQYSIFTFLGTLWLLILGLFWLGKGLYLVFVSHNFLESPLPLILGFLLTPFSLWILKVILTSASREVIVHEGGLLHRQGKKRTTALWEEIDSISQQITDRYRGSVAKENYSGSSADYQLHLTSGQILQFDEHLRGFDELGVFLQGKLLPGLTLRAMTALENGAPVQFGKIILHPDHGLSMDSAKLPFDKLHSAGMVEGSLVIVQSDSSEWIRIPSGQVPNLFVLLALLAPSPT